MDRSLQRQHLFCISIIFILSVWSAYVNRVPDGYIISGADFPFISDIQHHMQDLRYTWSNIGRGEGSSDERIVSAVFRYTLLYSLDTLGFSETHKVNFLFFSFVFLSAISVYLALGFFMNFKTSPMALLIVALAYSFNSYTIDGFRSSTMYHPFYDLYVFLPLIWSFFMRGIYENNYRFLIISVFIMLFSVSGFSNPAFFISLILFLGTSAFLYFILRMITTRQLLTVIPVFMLYLLLLSFYTIPLGYDLIHGNSISAFLGGAEAVVDVMRYESSFHKLSNMLRFQIADPVFSYPNIFPYLQGNSILRGIFVLLSFYPVFFVGSAMLFMARMKGREKKIITVFGAILVLFIYFSAKAAIPYVGNASIYIFSQSILQVLRKSDKILLFMPFIYSALAFFFFRWLLSEENKGIKIVRYIILFFCLVMVLLYPLPFLLGKFHENVFSIEVKDSIYKFKVKVPSDYIEAAKFLNKEEGQFKIMHMPFGGRGGRPYSGWLAYDKWHYVGSDTVKYYFRSPVIQSTYKLGQLDYGDYLNNNHDYKLFVALCPILNTGYMVVDNYVRESYINSFKKMFIKNNETTKDFEFVRSFGNLEIYQLNPKLRLPRIYAAPVVSTITSDIGSLIPLTYTPYLANYPALAFTEQQNRNSLISLVGSPSTGSGHSQQSAVNNQVLFSNSNFGDLVIDLAKAEAQPDSRQPFDKLRTQSAVGSQMPILVKLNREGRGKFEIKEDGVYDIWLRSDVKGIEGIRAIRIDKETYPITKEDIKGKWLRVGSKRFKPRWWGQHKIKVITKRPEVGGLQDIEVVVVSEGKRKVYEDLLRSKELSYLFYKEEGDSSGTKVSKPIGKREFYIPKGGEYEIKALIKPKREKVRAYAINEYKDGISKDWNFKTRNREQSKIARESVKSIVPVFLFGETFYPPETFPYPLDVGMWRWMSNDGKILIFNPFNTPVNVDISFSVASFKEERELRIILNNEYLKTLILSKPGEKVNKRFLEEIEIIAHLSRASGNPQKVELKNVLLKQGVNEMLLKPIPSATPVGKGNKFLVSIAVSDNLRGRFSNKLYDAPLWSNRIEFNGKVGEKGLMLEDNYRVRDEEVAWVTRYLDRINLYDYPLFIMKYSWSDNQVQGMEVGFRIDIDGDGKEDHYFVRTLPDPISGVNRFEIDLLEEIRNIFPDIVTKKAFLIGFDLFPHKRWGLDILSSTKKGIFSYQIMGIQNASKEASVVVLVDSESFKKLRFSEKVSYRLSQENRDLIVTIPLGGEKGVYRSTDIIIPIKYEFLNKNSTMILPFKVEDEGVENIILWIGYDTSGDGKADKFIPLGKKIPLFNWGLITKDMKEPMTLYEAKLPSSYPGEYTTKGKRFNNIVVLKGGKPLTPTWDNDFRITKEQVQVDGGKVVINLPREIAPDTFRYELYYIPKEWIKNSNKFPGFKEYAFELRELMESLPGRTTIPVELKFILEGKLAENLESEKDYKFYLKTPMYASSVLPSLENIELEKNLPFITLDSEKIVFKEQKIDKEKNEIWLEARLFLEEGEHRLKVNEENALEVYLAEIKPTSILQPIASNLQPPKIEFKKINPTRYIVDVKGANGPFTLVFSESFHEGWKGYVRQSKVSSQQSAVKTIGYRLETKSEPWSALWSAWKDGGKRIEIKDHFVVNGYANGWIVNPSIVSSRQSAVDSQRSAVGSQQSFEIVLEFKPQRLFEIGLIISMTTLFGCIGYLGYGWGRRRKKNSQPSIVSSQQLEED